MGGDCFTMRKFFINNSNVKGNKVYIDGPDYKHIKNVLRLKPGDNIIVNIGKDNEYQVEITGFTKDNIEADIIKEYNNQTEPCVNISLFQAIPKGEKMEYIIQKAVEIGVSKVIPIITDRVVVKIDDKNAKTKTERWQRVAEQASKQNKRCQVPEISNPIELKNSIEMIRKYDIALILYENESNNTLRDVLKKIDKSISKIAILVGPEGGLCENELEMLKEFHIVTLGNRILRTETAGLVTSAIILYETGDLG